MSPHKQHSVQIHQLEHRSQPVLSSMHFRWRLLRYVLFSSSLVIIALLVGMLGYHTLEGLSWVDSFLNAAMLLGGMGPVDAMKTDAGKIFSGFYALFAGLLFLVLAGIIFTPLIHRLLHKFHVAQEDLPDDFKS